MGQNLIYPTILQTFMPINKNSDETSSRQPFVVTIGRQFGCGGREIGKKIAESLGADYYDKTLLSKAAEAFGFSKNLFDRADEKRPSWLRSLLQYNYGVENAVSEFSDIDNEGLYQAQSWVIKQLAAKGPCVIVGRTADYILRDHPRIVSLFLHAPVDFRAERILKRQDAKDIDSARSMARKMDNARESYYSYYTNRPWGHADTYHLSIDTSRFTPQEIIELIRRHLDRDAGC